MDETKITGKLPNLDVEITRRELPEANAETITLRLTAVPSFEAFAGFLLPQVNTWMALFGAGRTNPWANLLFPWVPLAQAVWAPWLESMMPAVMQIRPCLPGERDSEQG